MTKESDKADKAGVPEETASQSKDPGEPEVKATPEAAEPEPAPQDSEPGDSAEAGSGPTAEKGNGAGQGKTITGKVETSPRKLKAKAGGKSRGSAKSARRGGRRETGAAEGRAGGAAGKGGEPPPNSGRAAQANGAADTLDQEPAKAADPSQTSRAGKPKRSRASGGGAKRSDADEQGSLDLTAPEGRDEAAKAEAAKAEAAKEERQAPPAPEAAAGRGKASGKEAEAPPDPEAASEPAEPVPEPEASDAKAAADGQEEKPEAEKSDAAEAPPDEADRDDQPAAKQPVAQDARLASLTAEDRPAATWSRGASRAWMLMLLLLLVIAGGLGWLYWDLGQTPEGQAPAGALAESDLRELEELLARLDFAPGRIDGVVDDQTRQAITAYQEAAGLPIDGEATAELLTELREVTRLMKTGG